MLTQQNFVYQAIIYLFMIKLEKSNTVYEYVINMKSCQLNECLKLMNKRDDGASSYFKNPVRESGRIEYARDLICKYGIVPDCAMPDTINALKSGNNIKLFTQKVKKDIFKLIYKKANLSQQQLREEKMPYCKKIIIIYVKSMESLRQNFNMNM